jgi:hypothetical protein
LLNHYFVAALCFKKHGLKLLPPRLHFLRFGKHVSFAACPVD